MFILQTCHLWRMLGVQNCYFKKLAKGKDKMLNLHLFYTDLLQGKQISNDRRLLFTKIFQ